MEPCHVGSVSVATHLPDRAEDKKELSTLFFCGAEDHLAFFPSPSRVS